MSEPTTLAALLDDPGLELDPALATLLRHLVGLIPDLHQAGLWGAECNLEAALRLYLSFRADDRREVS